MLIVLRKYQTQPRLSKMDTALNLLAGFSMEFQQAAHETRVQMNDGHANIAVVDDTEVESATATPVERTEFMKQINEVRKAIDYDVYQQQRDERLNASVCSRQLIRVTKSYGFGSKNLCFVCPFTG